jgi:hypothetical protein
MLTFGLVVEGDYDEAVLTEFIRRCAGHDVEIVSRVCNPRGSLMKSFPGFLEEFRYVKQGTPVDRALVVRDADMREPHTLLQEMEAKIAHRIDGLLTASQKNGQAICPCLEPSQGESPLRRTRIGLPCSLKSMAHSPLTTAVSRR